MQICCLNCTLKGGSGCEEMRTRADERESSHPSPECLKRRRKLSDGPGSAV